MKEVKKPTSRRNLDIAIDRLCTDWAKNRAVLKGSLRPLLLGRCYPMEPQRVEMP